MGFKHWIQGLEVISMFLVSIAIPCFFIGLWGSKMINDIGNQPSRHAEIQAAGGWKIILVEVFSFLLLISIFVFLYNLQNA